jgi:putative hemolysin
LEIAIGVALLALTLYVSILSYALRIFSRSRLVAHLSESSQRRWLGWLDRHEPGLQIITSALRLLCILSLTAYLYFERPPNPQDGRQAGEFIIPVVWTLGLLLVFGLGIPNALAVYAGEAVLARNLGILWLMRLLLLPVERAVLGMDFVIRRLLGKADASEEEPTERVEQEILEAVTEGELHGAVDQEQKEMIRSIFELHETTVSEIMTPRTDVVAVPVDCTFEQVRETIIQGGHSRIPVYEETLDHIVGVLYAKDLLRLSPGEPFDARRMMRTAPYVPESKTLDALLDEFRSTKVQIAIVLDEYGGTAGLATIEDILEELVGEIDDEYDQAAPPPMRRVDEDTLEVDARVHVWEINEELSVALPEGENYDTIGGFVFSALGKIPVRGESFQHENVRFEVMDAEPRRINRLRIRIERVSESV